MSLRDKTNRFRSRSGHSSASKSRSEPFVRQLDAKRPFPRLLVAERRRLPAWDGRTGLSHSVPPAMRTAASNLTFRVTKDA